MYQRLVSVCDLEYSLRCFGQNFLEQVLDHVLKKVFHCFETVLGGVLEAAVEHLVERVCQ